MTEETYGVEDALLGGPGLDGYAYRADTYCVEHGQAIAAKVLEGRRVDWLTFCDSEEVPQPIFFGEADSPQHCAECEAFLYGEAEDE